MSSLKITAALAVAFAFASAPTVYAQGANQGTTLGGSAKDNSASGGSEASGTSKAGMAGGGMSSGTMTKKGHKAKKSGAMSSSGAGK